MKKYDICITGSGPAGCACAYIASKLGLKTVLVEKNNYLGGLMTGGLVIPVMKTDSAGINTEFFEALISCAKKYNAQVTYSDGNKGWFNPNVLKIVLDELILSAGADILFECYPVKVEHDDFLIKKICFDSNILSIPIEAKYYVDSTGDSKIFKLSGLKFYNNNQEKQAPSLRFIMGGVDIKKLQKFLSRYDSNKDVTNSCSINGQIHLTSAYTWDNNGWNLAPIFNRALKNGELEPFDTAYFQIFTIPGAPDSIAFNCPRMRDYTEDLYTKSIDLILARKAIFRIANFMKNNFDGFENAYIAQIADITGIRESNNILAKVQCTIENMAECPPTRPILTGDYPIDIHSNKKDGSILKRQGKYFLQIESLMSKDFKNLFAAGRNLGADRFAQSALRTQLNCMSMGEAVARHIKSKINN